MEEKGLNNGDWMSFDEFCISYLNFVKDVDPSNSRDSYNSLIQFVTSLQVAFSNNRGSILQGVVKSTLSTVLNLSRQLDTQDSLQRTNYLSTLLLKMFNNIRAEKSVDSGSTQFFSKKAIILFVANMLCRSYYILKTEPSCANVFSNIHTANLKFSSYSKPEQVEYRYFLGRFYLSKEQLSRAYDHLFWAFANCLPGTPQQRLIVKYLIPASMLLGRLPSARLLDQFNLTQQYGPLVAAIKSGNYSKFMEVLEGPYKQWYISTKVMFLFRNRGPIILLRQLVYRTWYYLGKPGTIQFVALQGALNLSMSQTINGWYNPKEDENSEITENVFITLISQGFLKGNIYSRRGLVKLRDKGPFPTIASVHNMDSRVVYPTDKWLET